MKRYVPGMTPSSTLACVFAMLAMTMLVQYSDITICVTFASEHTLALPAMWTLAGLLLVGGLLHRLSRLRILSRAELLCVLYAMLIAAPLTTQGFWHRIVAITATNPRQGDFEKLDAMNDKLWPHGPNLLQGAFQAGHEALSTEGQCTWETIEVEQGKTIVLPVLSNAGKDDVSALRLRLPLQRAGRPFVVPGEPYMITVLARATDLGPTANYYCRAYRDDSPRSAVFFETTQPPKINFLHRKGFRRAGAYGVKFAPDTREVVVVEFGLKGNGRVELADPKLFSVAALESLYTGKKVVTASVYAALPPSERANLIVEPDSLWSWAGIRYTFAGYIPVRDWIGPVFVWTTFVLLLLMAILALNIILRNQWIDNERYLMPVARIPSILMDDEGAEDQSLPPIWKNRLMYAGFIVCLAWMLMKAWHFYNAKVPDLSIRIPLKDFFSDPMWHQMFNLWRFEIEGIFLPMCIFMELNVLMSLVLGYVAFKSQYWLGNVAGFTTNPNFPYPCEQAIGAYLGYAAVILFFTRKYLWRVFKAAVTGDRAASEGEALSYRGAFLLLAASIVGGLLWARWLGITLSGMLIFFLFLVAIGLVCSKIRTECGAPWGYLAPMNVAMFMGLLGGTWRFGPEAMIFCYMASFMLGPTVFYLIPGAQMELLGLGRRWEVTPRHLVYCVVLGVLGGMLIGGWVFLSNAYALGGNTSRYSWAFDSKWWYFSAYNQDLAMANNNLLGQAGGAAQAGVNPAWWACGISAAVTMLLAVLRQLFSGFWFHPVGFVLGSANFMDYIWGSALTAWVLRSVVLKLGGAQTVRNKLQPFFVGVFLGACAAYLVLLIHAGYLRAIGIDKVYPILMP